MRLHFVHQHSSVTVNPANNMPNSLSLETHTQELLVHELIAYQAERSPQKPAIQFGGECVTYAELIGRANQLARYLRGEGVVAGARIAISLNRSIEMVTGILGCLIAGAAYIPIDPAYPRERMAEILANSNSLFCITQTGLFRSSPKSAVKVILLDAVSKSIQRLPSDGLENMSAEKDLAYIIYTSGSTGAPKGVMVSHDSLRNFVRVSQSGLDVASDDVYLQSASISYALAVRQIMVPLSRGATLVVASDEQMRDPLRLFEEIKRTRVTLMDVVPSFWRMINKRLQDLPEACRSDLLQNHLRRIVCVGEALRMETPRDWRALAGNKVELVNIFGQTETTGVVATYPIPAAGDDGLACAVPIGQAIAQTRLYILNDHMESVLPGQSGELFISNPCLADGYIHLPELTAKKFISNPFDDGINCRLYRTGDVVRQREDGNIEFVGRSDSQIKIRGQRLELGEVESVLRSCPEVEDCAILVLKDQADENYLAAYIVPAHENVALAEIRAYCRRKMPDFMIPSRFVTLQTMPLSTNGKLDRRALAQIRGAKSLASTIEPPGNSVESRLMVIWRELLQQSEFGIHDDFFDLGGHSFMAVRLISRIEREFGIHLSVGAILNAPTISSQAALLEHANTGLYQEQILVPINPRGNKPILFGVHGHEGGVLYFRFIARQLPADQPFYALQAQGVDGVTPALPRIEDMALLYLQEIKKLQPHGPYYLCGFSLGGEIAYEMAQQLLKQGEQVKLLLMLDTRNPERLARTQVFAENQPFLDGTVRTMQWHLRRLSQAGFKGKVGYVGMLIQTKILRIALFGLVALAFAMKWRLSDRLLLAYLRTTHSKALHEYFPQPYAGKVTLFRSSQTEEQSCDQVPWSWEALALGGFEKHRFIASHNIIAEEYAPEVARKIKECLERASED